ncbi:MAG: NAD-binding protein [Phycisphaera sp.]|nr:NAD-binding protein [Phycisphaera sp.]
MATTSPVKSLGFIGLGVMGRSMAGHLHDAGYALHVHTRTKATAEALHGRGAVWHDTPSSLAPLCDAIITIVGYPRDVEEVYFGKDNRSGLLHNAKPGAVLIDMTTSSPRLAQRIAKEASHGGLAAVDAPVSGGDVGARNATLSIMVGSDPDVFERVKPILGKLGTNIVLQGPPGSGQHTKMCNQIAIASNMLGVCEAMVYAERSGLDPRKVLSSIEKGAAGSWSLSNLAPRMLDGNFDPGFFVKHFIKDMTIALESAKEMGLELPGLSLARSRYEELVRAGGKDLGTHALFKLYSNV